MKQIFTLKWRPFQTLEHNAALNTPNTIHNFRLRLARLSDIPAMAQICKEAFWLSPIDQYLAPKAPEHPEDFLRIMLHSIQTRFALSNSLTIVACTPTTEVNDEKIVGYGLFFRKGNDIGAKGFVRQKGILTLLALWWLRCWYSFSHWISNKIRPDRVTDFAALGAFKVSIKEDDSKYWTVPERLDRWHAVSVVVEPAYQRRGIGQLIMTSVIERSEKEGVPLGLEATPAGEALYSKLGFEMLGDFSCRIVGNERGGIMIRYPERWEARYSSSAA